MKSFKLIILALIGFAFSTSAQNKSMSTAVINTPTVQCGMCKKKIENYLSHQEGIKSVAVDIKKKTTTIFWITERTNIENVKTHIANAGYDAGDVLADTEAYKKLPRCCKKPEDQK